MRCTLFAVVALVPFVYGIPLTTPHDDGLVVVPESNTMQSDTSSSKEPTDDLRPPIISELNVLSKINNRFATTMVRTKVKNDARLAKEATFFIVLPENAFISNFSMEIGGTNYTAYVEEKAKAKQTYDNAVVSGLGAAHVAVSARDSNKFTVSVNVEPEQKVIFYLTYEELLNRKDALYEQVVNIHPNQLVKHMKVEVDINESRPITVIKTPPIRSGNEIAKENPELNSKANIEHAEPSKAKVTFEPDYEQQKQIAHGLGKEEKDGISGQFVVQYDVERDPRGGEVLVKDGYFVHFFAPTELEPMDQHVVFVLDTSGSMYDRKINQLKTAMHNILDALRPRDFFNLVEFNTNVKVWNLDAPLESTYFPNAEDNWYHGNQVFPLTDYSFPPAYPVNKNTIKKANKAVDDMEATGGTNIYEALRVGLHLIRLRQTRTGDADKKVQPLVVFLTDGDPTVGKTSATEIIAGIAEENIAKIPIISLSFGTGADRDFLQKISLRNTGFARHIYEDSDSSLQLQNFYNEISSPLLRNIKFEYTSDVTSLTRDEFPILYRGSEIVICGTYTGEEFNKESSKVVSWGRNGSIKFLPSVQKATGQLERLWAYKTVKQYLDAKDVAEGNTTEYEKKALELAKKYSFVTPITSLVVVKPNATKTVDTEVADGATNFFSNKFYASRPVSAPSGLYLTAGPAAPRFKMTSRIAAPAFGGFGGMPISQMAMTTPLRGFATAHSLSPHPGHFAAEAEDDIGPEYSDNKLLVIPDLYISTNDSVPTSSTPATTTTTTTTTTAKPHTFPPELEKSLSWLKEFYLPNGTLKFLKGNYQLGQNETSLNYDECTDPKSKEGLCVLLKDCEEIYDSLTSPITFKDYFCAIDNKFVGVCCAKSRCGNEDVTTPSEP